MATRKQLDKQKKAREETPKEKAERRQQQSFDRKNATGQSQGRGTQGGTPPPMHRPQGG